MSGKTVSISKGKGSIQHNNRQFLTENIDRQRVKDNIVYVKQDIREAYQQIFGKAVDDYNIKQKQKCRKIDDYYEKVRQSKNGEQLFHEVVVQVGDVSDSGYGTDDFNKCRQVLDDYMSDFCERNSHIHVFNAVMHLDESTPHLHISFIPIGDGYKTGMHTRNSLKRSMQEFATGDKVGILGWYEREREVLTERANCYGIEITQKNERRERLSVSEYKQTMREVERLTEVKNELKNDIKELERKKIESIEQKKELEELAPKKRLGHVSVEDYEELKKVAENYQSKLKLIEVENKELKQEVAENKVNQQKAIKEVEQLKTELFESKKEIKELRKEREDFKEHIETSVEQKYQHQLNRLKLDVEIEKEMNRGLVKKLEEVREESKALIERVTSEWKEKYSKLESTLNGVKQKFDEYKRAVKHVTTWRNEFLENHNLSEKWRIFFGDRKEEREMVEKWEKELGAKYSSREFVKEEVERRLEMVRSAREDNRRLEKLKQDDPEAYQREKIQEEKLRQSIEKNIRRNPYVSEEQISTTLQGRLEEAKKKAKVINNHEFSRSRGQSLGR